nr:MAG TPA: hypothetical protein [Caudoviricetes sp.]
MNLPPISLKTFPILNKLEYKQAWWNQYTR